MFTYIDRKPFNNPTLHDPDQDIKSQNNNLKLKKAL